MTHFPDQSQRRTDSSVRVAGRDYPVLDRLRVGRRTYLLLDHLSRAGRDRYLAFDPAAGPGGELRTVLFLPHSSVAHRHAKVLKRLAIGNDNVPRLFEYRTDGNRLILVLDWISGVTLAEYLARVKAGKLQRPSPYEAVRLVRGLAHGLYHLHHHLQVIHGDINPDNLIVATPRQRLVTIDFGSAWFAPRTATRSEGDGVRRPYAAPELQSSAAFVDFRADQFSASVVLFQLLALELPYDQLGGKAGRPEYVDQMRNTFVPPSRLSPDRSRLPRSLWMQIDQLVTTGLALDPAHRYPTPRAWLDAMDGAYGAMKSRSSLSPAETVLTHWIGKITAFLSRKGSQSR